MSRSGEGLSKKLRKTTKSRVASLTTTSKGRLEILKPDHDRLGLDSQGGEDFAQQRFAVTSHLQRITDLVGLSGG
jgi:hypothetical protein